MNMKIFYFLLLTYTVSSFCAESSQPKMVTEQTQSTTEGTDILYNGAYMGGILSGTISTAVSIQSISHSPTPEVMILAAMGTAAVTIVGAMAGATMAFAMLVRTKNKHSEQPHNKN